MASTPNPRLSHLLTCLPDNATMLLYVTYGKHLKWFMAGQSGHSQSAGRQLLVQCSLRWWKSYTQPQSYVFSSVDNTAIVLLSFPRKCYSLSCYFPICRCSSPGSHHSHDLWPNRQCSRRGWSPSSCPNQSCRSRCFSHFRFSHRKFQSPVFDFLSLYIKWFFFSCLFQTTGRAQWNINGVSYLAPDVPTLEKVIDGATNPGDFNVTENTFVLPAGKTVQITFPPTEDDDAHPFHLHGVSQGVSNTLEGNTV